MIELNTIWKNKLINLYASFIKKSRTKKLKKLAYKWDRLLTPGANTLFDLNCSNAIWNLRGIYSEELSVNAAKNILQRLKKSKI